MQREVTVDTQPRPYPVIIQPGALDHLGTRLAAVTRVGKVAVITDANVGPLYSPRALHSLSEAGFDQIEVVIPPGEPSKSLEMLGSVFDILAEAHIDRTSTLVALGGGVIGDLAGLAAATWLRGVSFVQCPTTLEADVDASVGGKTAVNHPSGKNLIGAFHQPLFVLIDTDTLATLSDRDYRAALAESIKHAVIRDAALFEWHEAQAEGILAREADLLGELIERNVRIKADIVARDERETSGLRALLNFGHTVGHAIESAMARHAEPWRHGECVAVGMVAAVEMSVAARRLDPGPAERIVRLIERFGLPVRAPLAGCRDELKTLMNVDKKVAGGRLRFVLSDGIGRAELRADIEPAWIDAGLDRCLTP